MKPPKTTFTSLDLKPAQRNPGTSLTSPHPVPKRKLVTGTVLLLSLLQAGCSMFGNRDVLRMNDDPVAREAQSTKEELSSPYEELTANSGHREELTEQALDAGDVVLGMNMQQVMSSWGRPSEVEIAGDTESGNQKWTYSGGLMGRLKINPSRIVYFERGRVAGWETQ